MTSPRLRQAASGKRSGTAILISCLALGLAGCSGAAAQVQLPTRPAAAHPASATRPAVLTSRQQVIAAMTAYTTALREAGQSKSPAQARQLLRPYLAASRISGMVHAMSSIWSRGDTFYGEDVLHISSVAVQRRRAFVHDCDNTSGMGLQDSAGQPVPGSAGVPRDNLVTRLALVRGHWLVQFQLVEDVTCKP